MTASTGQRFAFKRSKYFAKKVKLDGITFDSKREAAVYQQLKVLERTKKISDLVVHHRFELFAPGNGGVLGEKVGEYEADFLFTENGELKVVDVKGFDTPLSAWKRKHLKAQDGIEVEVWK